MFRFTRLLTVAFIMCLALAGAGWGTLAAQDDAPASHPSHIHAGNCADLDPNPAYPLMDVAPVSEPVTPDTVELGTTTLDVSFDDLVATPHAINVHESADNIATYIACGDLDNPVVNGTMLVGLYAQNDSGYTGVAVLSAADSGTGIDVVVYLTSSSANTADQAPADATGDVAVSIIDFGFDAATVEVPVGTTVTWTNDGDVIHTTTSKDGLWDSAIMNSGDTFSYTFEDVGTFDYLCSLHPSMVGTIVVTAP